MHIFCSQLSILTYGTYTGVNVVCDVQALAAQLGAKPEFIVAGASYQDINQGQLGTYRVAQKIKLLYCVNSLLI